MKLKIRIILLVGVVILLAAGLLGCAAETGEPAAGTVSPTPAAEKTIAVFAGAASKPPLDEAARAFEAETGIKVYVTYGGSGAMLSQMILSKTGDVYIPGSPDYLVKSEREKITDPASAKIAAYLVPAIIVQKGNPKNIRTLADLAKPGVKVGIGNPGAVCLGLYSVELLEYNGLLEKVYPNIVTQAESCEKTATLISLKSVDAVIGWSVFQDWDPENIEAVYLEPEQIPRLAYVPAAVSTFTKEKEGAERFISFLVSPTGQDIFKGWGYDVSEDEVRQFAPEASIGGEYQLPEAYKELGR